MIYQNPCPDCGLARETAKSVSHQGLRCGSCARERLGRATRIRRVREILSEVGTILGWTQGLVEQDAPRDRWGLMHGMHNGRRDLERRMARLQRLVGELADDYTVELLEASLGQRSKQQIERLRVA